MTTPGVRAPRAANEPERKVVGPDAQAAEPASGRARRRLAWLPMALIAAPFTLAFLALAVHAYGLDWAPGHDFALIEMNTHAVGTGQTPLLGPYSRFGWNHPGPLMFELLAGPYRVLGERSSALLVGAVLLNAGATAGALLVARRRGGPWLVASVAVLFAILVHSLGANTVISPWNPWITVLPAVLLILLAWSVAVRDWAMIPFAIGVGSFLVQTHVGYGVIVAVVAATTIVAAYLAPRAEPAPTRRRLLPMVAVGVIVGAVLWAPPLLDQVTGSHNASIVARYFLQPSAGGPGWNATFGVVARETSPIGVWISGAEPTEVFTGGVEPASALPFLIPIGALTLAAVIAARRRDADGLALLGVASATLVATVYSVSRIDGVLLAYLVRFTWPTAVVVWLAVGRAVLPIAGSFATSRLPAWVSSATSAAAVAAAIVTVLVVTIPQGLVGAQVPDPEISVHALVIEAAVVPVVAGGDGLAAGGAVLVRPLDLQLRFPAPSDRVLAVSVLTALEKAGVTARAVDSDWPYERGNGGRELFGRSRLDQGGEVTGTITVASGDQLDTYVPPAGSRELIRIEDRAATAEQRALAETLTAEFVAAGHPEAVPLLGEDQLRWVPLSIPDLGTYQAQIGRLVELRALPHLAVFWHPGR